MSSDESIESDLSLMSEIKMLGDHNLLASLVYDQDTQSCVYQINAQDVISSSIEIDELMMLKSCGWKYNKTQEVLTRKY